MQIEWTEEERLDVDRIREMTEVLQRFVDRIDDVDDVDTFTVDVAGHLFDVAHSAHAADYRETDPTLEDQ